MVRRRNVHLRDDAFVDYVHRHPDAGLPPGLALLRDGVLHHRHGACRDLLLPPLLLPPWNHICLRIPREALQPRRASLRLGGVCRVHGVPRRGRDAPPRNRAQRRYGNLHRRLHPHLRHPHDDLLLARWSGGRHLERLRAGNRPDGRRRLGARAAHPQGRTRRRAFLDLLERRHLVREDADVGLPPPLLATRLLGRRGAGAHLQPLQLHERPVRDPALHRDA